jgi:hypothetical protein
VVNPGSAGVRKAHGASDTDEAIFLYLLKLPSGTHGLDIWIEGKPK